MIPAVPSTDAAQSATVTTAAGSGHENHQGGPAGGRGVDTTAAPGPAAETPRMTAIASAMAAAEDQPRSQVRLAGGAIAEAPPPAPAVAGGAGSGAPVSGCHGDCAARLSGTLRLLSAPVVNSEQERR